jgi:hypothetical protein
MEADARMGYQRQRMRGFFNGWGGGCRCAEFFAEDGVGWVVFFDFAADEFFGGAVGGGDGAVVGFVVGADAGVEVAEGDASGAVGQVGGEGEERGKIHGILAVRPVVGVEVKSSPGQIKSCPVNWLAAIHRSDRFMVFFR